MITGVRIFKKGFTQKQGNFKDDVCNEYNEFLKEFTTKDGIYYDMYKTLIIVDTPEDEARAKHIQDKIQTLNEEIKKAIVMADQKKEVPVIDAGYYRKLYRKFETSNKSSTAKEQLTNEMFSAINALILQIDSYEDKYFPGDCCSSVKILRITKDLTQEKLKDMVCQEYNFYMQEFLLEGGAYYDMFKAMLEYERQKSENDMMNFEEKSINFYRTKIDEILEIAKKRTEVPCPNIKFYIAMYRKYKALSKSSDAIEQLTKEFVSANNALFHQLNAALDEISDGDDVSYVKILKKTSDMTQKQFQSNVQSEYNEFEREFILKEAPYSEMYQAMYSRMVQIGSFSTDLFLNKYKNIKTKMNKVNEMAQDRDEVPCLNIKFYRALFNKQKSDKSTETDYDLSVKFMEALDDLSFQIDWYYDKTFPVQSNNGLKIFKKGKLSTTEFRLEVLRNYNHLLYEFIIEDGYYFDLYEEMENNAIQKGTLDEFNKIIGSLVSKDADNVIELSKYKEKLPLPDDTYFLAIYYEYKNSPKTTKAIEKATEKFLSAIDELSKNIRSIDKE